MDRAQEAIERARASEQTLASLRAELADLEKNTGGPSLTAAAADYSSSRGGGGRSAAREEPLSVLGTSIDDLARLHEGHAATMRSFGTALGGGQGGHAAPMPTPSAEPMMARRDIASAYADRDVLAATGAASAAAAREARLTGSAPSLSGVTRGGASRPAFDRPLSSSNDGSAPMQRSVQEIRDSAAQASARAVAATEARYAAQAAQARSRVEAAAAKQATRSAYLLERDGAATERAIAALTNNAAPPEPASARAASTRPSSARAAFGGGGGAGGGSSGGGAPAHPPVTSIRMPLERPRSAPKERPRVTVPVPFSFEHRQKKETAAERRMTEEQEERQRAMERAAKESTRARDLPPSTAPGLYSEMVAEAEAASRERRQVRRTVPVPFSFSHRRTKEPKRSDVMPGEWTGFQDASAEDTAGNAAGASAEGGLWYENGELVGKRTSFKAKEVPRSMSEPRWEIMRVQEAERRERVAQAALESAARSKLPPRMQLHKENERARKAADAERVQRELDAELTLKPEITDGVPDFDRMHLAFERTLARKRNQRQGTTPQPFRMESEPYRMMQREVKQVRDEMIQRDIRRDELVMPERRWPYLSTQAPIGRKNIPDFKREHQAWTERAPNAGTTEKLEAHKRKLAEESRQQAKAEKAEAEAERQRQQAQKNITLKVSNRLKQVAGDPRDIKAAAKAESSRRKEEHRQAWKERKKTIADQMEEMNKRIDARPFLFEQASIDVAVERAKAEAYDKFDATLRKHGISTTGLADRLDPK